MMYKLSTLDLLVKQSTLNVKSNYVLFFRNNENSDAFRVFKWWCSTKVYNVLLKRIMIMRHQWSFSTKASILVHKSYHFNQNKLWILIKKPIPNKDVIFILKCSADMKAPQTGSSPRYPLRSHSLVCTKNHLFIVGIGPIYNKELEFIYRSDRSDRTCVYSQVSEYTIR